MDGIVRITFVFCTIFQSVIGIHLLWSQSCCPTILMIYTLYGMTFQPIILLPYCICRNVTMSIVSKLSSFAVASMAVIALSIHMRLLSGFCNDRLMFMAFVQGLTIPGIVSLTIETLTQSFERYASK